MLAIVRKRIQEQEALEAEIRGMGRTGVPARPATPNGKAVPNGSAAR
jgi:hypothetical protein